MENFTPGWQTEYSPSEIGIRGTLHGWYDDLLSAIHINLLLGNDSVVGKGDWSFSIPNQFGNIAALGYAKAEQIGVRAIHGYCVFDPMTRLVFPIFPGRPGDSFSHIMVEQFVPFYWKNGDKLRISINKI